VSAKLKQALIQITRDFFLEKNFTEVETPLLYPAYPLEPGINLFETAWYHSRSPDQENPTPKTTPLYLSPSPETHLKKLLAQGIGDCFTITKAFRNEPSSSQHSPEFTILEWYEIDKDYQNLMDSTQSLIYYLSQKLKNSSQISYQNQKIKLSPPWPRISLNEAFKEFAQIDLSQNLDSNSLQESAQKKGYAISSPDEWEPLYNQIFLNEVEPGLFKKYHSQPFILYDYPTILSPLCKSKKDGFSERFEFYVAGLELGDCYTELTDPSSQEKNFKNESTFRQKYGLPTHPYDQQLISALKKGLPPCSGIAVGLDRLAMLFANTTNIKDVNHFTL
jgi:EF-P lysine aminoacylase GenX